MKNDYYKLVWDAFKGMSDGRSFRINTGSSRSVFSTAFSTKRGIRVKDANSLMSSLFDSLLSTHALRVTHIPSARGWFTEISAEEVRMYDNYSSFSIDLIFDLMKEVDLVYRRVFKKVHDPNYRLKVNFGMNNVSGNVEIKWNEESGKFQIPLCPAGGIFVPCSKNNLNDPITF